MKRYTGIAAVIVLTTIAATASRAQESEAALNWPELSARLERAALRGFGSEMRAIRTDLLRQLTQPSAKFDVPRLQYTLAYIGWRMANIPDVTEREQADLLDDAVRRLQEVVKTEASNGEAYALLGSVYGLQTARTPAKAVVLGPRASSARDRAVDIAPNNPRVVLLQAISVFNTPAAFGGSLDKAERLLRESVELFAREPATKSWPNWGRFDVHVWLGQALLKRGDPAGARAEYDMALAIAPDSGWVRFELLPALEKTSK